MAEYTPSEAEARMIYHRGMKTQRPYVSPADAHSEFDRFLARVRRDAARGALDGLITWHLGNSHDTETPIPIRRGLALMAYEAQRYRDTYHPEETP